MPITIPDKVTITLKGQAVEVSGPLGKLLQALPPGMTVKVEKNVATVEPTADAGEKAGSLHGLSRSLVNNAVIGVTQGFKKELEIVGLGYRAAVAGPSPRTPLGS